MKKIIAAIFSVFILSACDDGRMIGLDTIYKVHCNSFVFGYWYPESETFYAKNVSDGLISIESDNGYNGHKQYFGAFNNPALDGESKSDAAKYRAYLDKCERYSDNGYDTVYWYCYGNPNPAFGYVFFAEEVRKVEITYDRDYNGVAAGGNIGEFFTLYAISPLDYIRRGYCNPQSCGEHPSADIFAKIHQMNHCDYRWYVLDIPFGNFYGEPVVRKVSEITENDLRLIGGCDVFIGRGVLFLLKPDILPEDTGGRLTISLVTDREVYHIPYAGFATINDPIEDKY